MVSTPVLLNSVDASYLRENLEIYYQFPPVFKLAEIRWNDPWNEDCHPTPEPLTSVEAPYQQVFLDEAADYAWICYAKLKK